MARETFWFLKSDRVVILYFSAGRMEWVRSSKIDQWQTLCEFSADMDRRLLEIGL